MTDAGGPGTGFEVLFKELTYLKLFSEIKKECPECPLSRKMRHIFLKRSGIAPLKVIIVGSAVAAVDPTRFLPQIYHYISIYSIILKHLSLNSEKEERIRHRSDGLIL
ncbi:MAG: hypothetical protein IK085_02500 [Clostridia bacterium]|nr:hypothetical protein [Clostridia bacterium]